MYLLSSDQAAAVIICSIIEMGLSILLDISIILLINNTGLTGRGVPAPLPYDREDLTITEKAPTSN